MGSRKHVIGIDLCTTNSVVAVVENGEPVIISNAKGNPSTPSVIGFDEQGEAMVGERARRQAATQPQKTVFSVKRLIGRMYDEICGGDETQCFVLGGDKNGQAVITLGDREYFPAELSSLILGKIKESAEAYLGQSVSRAPAQHRSSGYQTSQHYDHGRRSDQDHGFRHCKSCHGSAHEGGNDGPRNPALHVTRTDPGR